MSLQTRLAALIAAIGADIKSLAAGKADASKGVTNGDAHDHSGGDGAQIAYSSLSGLPTLGTAAPLNVAASGNAAAGEVVKGNDTRLSDSREWTASTVSQAEAEAGTATTRRAWTAQRVRQAIAAWWDSASTAAGRALVSAASAAAQRDVLGVSNHNLVAVDSTGNVTLPANRSFTGSGLVSGGFSVGPASSTGSVSVKGRSNTSTAYCELDPIPSDGISLAIVRLFRTVNTAGATSMDLCVGDGTGTLNHRLFGKGDTSRLCSNNGNLSLGNTAGIVDLVAGKLKFPATQVQSSDPNTLDDYEEGTWTPIYSPVTGAFDLITYGPITTGTYTKIGRSVTLHFLIRTDAITVGTASGAVRLAGFPFAAAIGNAGVLICNLAYVANFAGEMPSAGYASGAATYVTLAYRTAADGALQATLQVSDLDTGADKNYLIGSVTYNTAT